MSTLVSLDAQPLTTADAPAHYARPRWKRIYSTRIVLLLAWALSFIAVFRAASVWNEKATDNGEESRSHVRAEVTRWISQQSSAGEKASILALGGIQRGIIPHESWLEAMIDDPSKPGNARLSICRFTLDASGSIVDAVERSIPYEAPR
jgi:hypothetical protein